VSTSSLASPTTARAAALLSSTIGRKALMAASGLVLYGFVIGHMLGNLQVFLGPEALNAYAEMLQHALHGTGVWIARGVLLLAVLLHIWTAASLTVANAGARPVGYREWQARQSTYASRTMVWSGPLLLLFIVYHLAHFTTGHAHPDFVRGDVYRNLVVGFQNPFASAFYILAMLALGLHMYHGFWSMLQTLGASHPRWTRLRGVVSGLLAFAVVVGNISMPVAVLFGIIHL
jgi:succinate dehydrogenase / fumarate reductase, cytochrome b subunit